MTQPLVSICIPAYNAEKFIGDTIRSALAQTYRNLEIIVCNDCSSDNTLQVAKSFSDPRMTVYVNEHNLGCSGNYNRSLSYARGKYVKLLCADDMITPDCIEKQVRAFEENEDKNIVMVTAGKYVINENGKRVFSKKFPGKGCMEGKKAVRKSVLYGTNIFGEPGLLLMKTDILRKTTGVTEDKYYTMCNDFDLWCKMLLHGNLFVIHEPLFSFRIVSSSQTARMGWRGAGIFKNYCTLLYRQKKYDISPATLFIGKIMMFVMMFARNTVVYLFTK
ncbi:MAG: glycosyltransferase family 2 protein [Prevotellaceae bacterium]|jgi:glycosyltransferase involved in cell wall biosynthesis|nr:glycosyltransferase family 2 protein [Prevotellaceae bacterium]